MDNYVNCFKCNRLVFVRFLENDVVSMRTKYDNEPELCTTCMHCVSCGHELWCPELFKEVENNGETRDRLTEEYRRLLE